MAPFDSLEWFDPLQMKRENHDNYMYVNNIEIARRYINYMNI